MQNERRRFDIATRRAVVGAALALLAGCATVPESLRGEFAALDPSAASTDDTGERVRWGGTLLEVTPERDRTCFEVLAHPLGDDARPLSRGQPGRRFLACRDGFVDPAAYPLERSVSVAGTLASFITRKIGAYDYRYPVVDADTVYLWPPRESGAPPPWWYDPFYPYPRGFAYPHHRRRW